MNGHEGQPEDPRRDAWSAYWAQGALHSCIGSYEGNYAGAIGNFWRAIFADVRRGARVLDLATGNGPLPLQLWESLGPGAGLRIDAVDLAAVAPPWYREGTHRGITFHPGVAMERLPFADADFDWVVSQFGFEYAQRDDALRECLRVTSPSGTIALVLHHADSVLVRVGRSELAHHDALMAPDGLIAASRDVLPWIARVRGGEDLRGDAAAADARARYNAAMARLQQAMLANDVPDALVEARDRIHPLLAGVTPETEAATAAALEHHAQALGAAALRTREMIGHALDAGQANDLAAAIQAARPGSVVQCEPLRQREGILAWGLTARQK